MNASVSTINESLEPLRNQLLAHSVYDQMIQLRHVQVFMEHHVYAVWDFMSLLKARQRKFGVFQIPWTPSPNPDAVRLLNEIAVCEECDEAGDGGYKSHFELYRESMETAGASTQSIDGLIQRVRKNSSHRPDMKSLAISSSVKSFITSTFDIIDRNDDIELASTFLYGREDLLPGLFTQVVKQVSREYSGCLDPFVYYLDRHIEVDEGEHGPAAVRLLESLCDGRQERVARAQDAAVKALRHRLELWDGILVELNAIPPNRVNG